MTLTAANRRTEPSPRRDASALRIGFYTSALPHPERKPGGVDVHVDRLAEQLTRRGHHVVVFTYSSPIVGRTYEVRSLTPASTATSRLRRTFVAPVKLNMLDTSELDILHLHGDDWFYLHRRLPTVRTFYGSAYYEARHASGGRRRAPRLATYGLELVAARLATAAYGIIPGDGPGYGTSGYLPLAVDLPAETSFRREGAPTLLFVGAWEGRKRGRLLYEVFQRDVRPHVRDAHLVMVSDRCDPGPGVTWAPLPSDAQLLALYRSAWVFCMPSLYEGFGLPYLEAMANGTPVVATSNPGSRFVLDGGRAGLITPDKLLGAAIVRLLLDDEARTELAVAARERATDFGWEDTIDRHEDAYRAAIARFASTL